MEAGGRKCAAVLVLNRCCHRGVVIYLDGGWLETFEDLWRFLKGIKKLQSVCRHLCLREKYAHIERHHRAFLQQCNTVFPLFIRGQWLIYNNLIKTALWRPVSTFLCAWTFCHREFVQKMFLCAFQPNAGKAPWKHCSVPSISCKVQQSWRQMGLKRSKRVVGEIDGS